MNDLFLLICGGLLIIGAAAAFVFAFRRYRRTGGRRFGVDYGGHKQYYKNAKDQYRTGQRVTLYYEAATDTTYRFTLDGKALEPVYDNEKGFAIVFTMPEHDVILRCESENISVEK